MSKASVEDIKLASEGLRGTIAEQFADSSLSHISEDANVLLAKAWPQPAAPTSSPQRPT